MYGGLFGDLPEAKNSKKAGDPDADKINEKSEPSKVLKDEKSKGADSKIHLPQQTKAGVLPKPSGKGPRAAAGISMAFIPAAARVRKKQQASTLPVKKIIPSISTAVTTTLSSTHVPESLAVSTYITQQSTISNNPSSESIIRSVHEPSKYEDTSLREDGSVEHQGQEGQPQDEFVEPEELRILHEEAKSDPYDPLVPNDLLQYWERKAFETDRMQLEKERQRTLEEQDRIREQLKKEREELARSGDVQQLVEHHRTKSTMGRGRGVSNIPAWVLDKMKREESQELGGAPDSKKQRTHSEN